MTCSFVSRPVILLVETMIHSFDTKSIEVIYSLTSIQLGTVRLC